MKACFKCGVSKPLSEFYAHKAMSDGHLNKCKACTKLDVSRRVDDKRTDPEWMAAERARCRDKQAKYRKLGLAKNSPGAQKRWAKRNPQKRRAQGRAKSAQGKGFIQPPPGCEKCGAAVKLEKHHPDYSKPLFVQWLCPPCHGLTRRK